MVKYVGFAIALSLSVWGCGDSHEYGECAAPDDHLKIMFKPASSVNVFSHSFCVVCNPQLDKSEYGNWAAQMGSSAEHPNADELHPCLYAYGTPKNPTPDNFASCRSMICGKTASYNDMVNKSNGNFDLSPILE